MTSTEIVDTAGLAAHLATVVPQAGVLDGVELLTGGSSNLTLLATCARQRIVLRRRPVGLIPEQAHDMRREYETLHMLAPTPVPVPAVYGYCDDESLLGAPFYAMEFVPGTVVQTAADLRGTAPADRVRICDDLVRVLAELHAVPLQTFPTYQPGRSTDVLQRHLRRWHDRWAARPHRVLPEVDRIAAELRRRLPEGSEVTFVHGDYRIGNVIVDREAARPVRAVLDWELATFGHPLTDLAHLLAYWEGTGDLHSHRAQRIAREAGLPDGRHLAAAYAAYSGRGVDDLPVFLAFEHWRAAIIKEAIYQRRLRADAPRAEVADARGGVDRHLAEAAARLEAC
ncbi:phosphotransferase family protein [Amycolatopsis jejuensis]|uniref:phosphotransferase family protein n=1 Tax=Amycolatopsis jejuensis TaxID=330084 RepID=UPI000689CBF2|nr:phosphotransferase family protein [Amycolatopsis jejuensis]